MLFVQLFLHMKVYIQKSQNAHTSAQLTQADTSKLLWFWSLTKMTPILKVLIRPLLSLSMSIWWALHVPHLCCLSHSQTRTHYYTNKFLRVKVFQRQGSPMKPKMSLMVGTKITSMLLKTSMPAAITMWRIQLNSRPLNSRVVMEERIWIQT